MGLLVENYTLFTNSRVPIWRLIGKLGKKLKAFQDYFVTKVGGAEQDCFYKTK